MQAARGTPLSSEDSSSTSVTPATDRPRVLGLFVIVAVVLFSVDQGTKALAVARLSPEKEEAVVGDVLVLHLTRNAGAAFSAGTAYTVVLTCLAIAALAAVLWTSRRLGHRGWAVALGLLLAGVGGNLSDRLLRSPGPLRGQVIDFLMLPHWPVFNVADVCIDVAALLILVQAVRGVRVDGSRPGHDPSPAT